MNLPLIPTPLVTTMIGPLYDQQCVVFGPEFDAAEYNYVKNTLHDEWRQFLPFVIELWKTGTTTVQTEGDSAWFRPDPTTAHSDGGTTGTIASRLQLEFQSHESIKTDISTLRSLARPQPSQLSLGGSSSQVTGQTAMW